MSTKLDGEDGTIRERAQGGRGGGLNCNVYCTSSVSTFGGPSSLSPAIAAVFSSS